MLVRLRREARRASVLHAGEATGASANNPMSIDDDDDDDACADDDEADAEDAAAEPRRGARVKRSRTTKVGRERACGVGNTPPRKIIHRRDSPKNNPQDGARGQQLRRDRLALRLRRSGGAGAGARAGRARSVRVIGGCV